MDNKKIEEIIENVIYKSNHLYLPKENNFWTHVIDIDHWDQEAFADNKLSDILESDDPWESLYESIDEAYNDHEWEIRSEILTDFEKELNEQYPETEGNIKSRIIEYLGEHLDVHMDLKVLLEMEVLIGLSFLSDYMDSQRFIDFYNEHISDYAELKNMVEVIEEYKDLPVRIDLRDFSNDKGVLKVLNYWLTDGSDFPNTEINMYLYVKLTLKEFMDHKRNNTLKGTIPKDTNIIISNEYAEEEIKLKKDLYVSGFTYDMDFIDNTNLEPQVLSNVLKIDP